MSVQSSVKQQFTNVAKQQNITLAPLSDDLGLLDSGLDSLCLAVVVARLEDELGVDPFASTEESKLPVTVGDFVHLYEDAVNKKQK
jgi:acyl carrier protein